MSDCKHNNTYDGICGDCGADMEVLYYKTLDELAECNKAWKIQGNLLIERKRRIDKLNLILEWLETYDKDAVQMSRDIISEG